MSEVSIKVNGEHVGSVDSGKTLSAAVQRVATERGIKTFSVLLDGSKADTSKGGRTLESLHASTIELVTKDARGGKRRPSKHRALQSSFHKGQAVVLRDSGIIGKVVSGGGDLYEVNTGDGTTSTTGRNLRALTASERA